jgi:hypothetical protein
MDEKTLGIQHGLTVGPLGEDVETGAVIKSMGSTV